ncbi:hypothetical protein [Methermicoccus shengliensis]|uniref:hypothetical protein n=1 Tax=Methermicoccus shengliensis TaxID=660064 RepID=UPI0006939EDC|nr:MAG: Transcriptional regulator [Euryarchaeota archaeon 55_53]KUK30704.1 MAG: Transcriptional regulator [Methanosarcinales archeaon 56_1174]MDI3487298.1 hypothetical protein [Methanosarcinales archaeon]MDN5294628.1 hypothetical protein [Methanosarcinales archaeon]
MSQKEIIEETRLTKGTVSKKESGDEKITSEINEILLKNFTEDEKRTLQTLLKKMLRNIELTGDVA